VEKVWFTGSLSGAPGAVAKLHIHVITHSGERFEESGVPMHDTLVQEKLIAAAENWLNTLIR
jgi:hypothetical protein